MTRKISPGSQTTPPGTAGYSGTPLPKKIGLKEGCRYTLLGAPDDFRARLGTLPDHVKEIGGGRSHPDLVVLFARSRSILQRRFSAAAGRLAPAGMIWVAWPKKASGVRTDLDFTIVQRTGLAHGLVDTKICAIDDTWSALRFVRRLQDRPEPSGGRKPS